MKILLAFDKETKNTYRYAEIAENGVRLAPLGVIDSVYIKKAKLPAKPSRITITIEELDTQPMAELEDL